MQSLTAPNYQLEAFRRDLEEILGQSLRFIKHVLFPHSIYLTSRVHNNETEEENFYLIYDIQKDRGGQLQANIHFFQIPFGLRQQKLGTKIYLLLEHLLKCQNCTSITLEARVNTLNPKDNSVSFWGRQGFVPGVHFAFDDENFPMLKRLT